MLTSPRLAPLAAAALAGSVLLSGCSGGDSAAPAKAAPVGSTASPSSSSSSSSSDPNAADRAAEASKAGIDPANPPKPIASATAAAVVEGDPKATMRLDLLGLKRTGKTVLATFAFTVTSPGGSTRPQWIYDYLGDTGWHPQLVDTTNLKLHRVVKAGGRPVATDYQGAKFAPGQTLYAYAVFAAPPSDVTTMDVIPSDNVPALPDVPLS